MININIDDNNAIKVKINDKDGAITKDITVQDLINLLQASVQSNEKNGNVTTNTPILQMADNHITTIQYKQFANGKEYYVFLRDSLPVENFIYHNKTFKSIGIPTLLFAISVFKNSIQGIKIAAVKKKDSNIKDNTPLYFYPFSHVSGPKNFACLGGNNIAKMQLKSSKNLSSIPDMFLSMPNTDDSYGGKNNSDKDLRPLLEELEGKGVFPEKYLKDCKLTYKEWYEDLK